MMELSRFQSNGVRGFILRGECPHCGMQAAFPTACEPTQPTQGSLDDARMAAVCQCIACSEYILAILKTESLSSGRWQWKYEIHYPLGNPNDDVAEEIPDDIKPDFQEALRCRSVNAYNATIEMCRRALEASCLQLGAKQDAVLNDMIEWVFKQGKITAPLRDMAHKIKLGGNRAAHPSDRTLTQKDADAVIEFTTDYFHHVYVMPARMAQFNFDKPKKGQP